MAGRKKRLFTEEEQKAVEEMARFGCPDVDICSIFDISISLLRTAFPKVLKIKRAERRNAIRMAQTRLALEDKNTSMLIWLGKNELEQTDKFETKNENTGPGGTALFPPTINVNFVKSKGTDGSN